MTLPASGSEAQRAFHLAAGVDGISEPGSATEGWTIEAEPDELWWPRGGKLDEVLAEVPAEYDAVQALVRPFVSVQDSDTLETMAFRLSGQSSLRLVARAPEPRRPLRSWFPIEVLTLLPGRAVATDEIEAGLAVGVIHRDLRAVEAFAGSSGANRSRFRARRRSRTRCLQRTSQPSGRPTPSGCATISTRSRPVSAPSRSARAASLTSRLRRLFRG